MKFTCKNCSTEVEIQPGQMSSYNQMALEDGWCERCWYYEHWRPYQLWIGEKGFGVHGWAKIDPPDHLTVYYEMITTPNYEKRDWRGNHTWDITPERYYVEWLQEDEKEIAKRLSKEYKTAVIVHGARPEEKDKIFFVAIDGQLFVPVVEEKKEDG